MHRHLRSVLAAGLALLPAAWPSAAAGSRVEGAVVQASPPHRATPAETQSGGPAKQTAPSRSADSAGPSSQTPSPPPRPGAGDRGVIAPPPSVESGMTTLPPPAGGAMPVIPPPVPPGGDRDVVPH